MALQDDVGIDPLLPNQAGDGDALVVITGVVDDVVDGVMLSTLIESTASSVACRCWAMAMVIQRSLCALMVSQQLGDVAGQTAAIGALRL